MRVCGVWVLGFMCFFSVFMFVICVRVVWVGFVVWGSLRCVAVV